jgi:hypothetical protein
MKLCYPPGVNEREALTTMLQEVMVMKPRAWESGKGKHLCLESMESLPGTKAGGFSIPESLTKDSCIFKSYLRNLPYVGTRR